MNDKLIMCSDRLPDKSGNYKIKNSSSCNDGNGEMFYSTENGWDIPDMIKGFYRVVGWFENTIGA